MIDIVLFENIMPFRMRLDKREPEAEGIQFIRGHDVVKYTTEAYHIAAFLRVIPGRRLSHAIPCRNVCDQSAAWYLARGRSL